MSSVAVHLGNIEAIHMAFIVTAAVSAFVVLLAFTKWASRWLLKTVLDQGPALSEQLTAGIWVKTFSAIGLGALAIMHIYGRVYPAWLVWFAWGGMIFAYYLHITAWAPVHFGTTKRDALVYAAFLLVVFWAVFLATV